MAVRSRGHYLSILAIEGTRPYKRYRASCGQECVEVDPLVVAEEEGLRRTGRCYGRIHEYLAGVVESPRRDVRETGRRADTVPLAVAVEK